MNHFLIGTATLALAIGVSISMLRSARLHLNDDQLKRFNTVRRANWMFFPMSITLIVTYFSVRQFLPHYHLGNVLFLWTAYNVLLWIKMRRVMRGFQLAALPPNFQLNYIFSQIVSYTGLVVSMLILSEANQL